MNLMKGFVVLFVFALCAVLPASASHIDLGASNHGANDTGSCLTDTTPDACQSFASGTFDIGGTTLQGGTFAFSGGSPATATGYDILELSASIGVGDSVTFTLPSTDTSSSFGVFVCGDPVDGPLEEAQDSGGKLLPNVPCTPGLSPSTTGAFTELDNSSAGTAQFTFDEPLSCESSGPCEWVFYALPNDLPTAISLETVTTPEPSSLALTVAGMIGILAIFRRPRKVSL